MRMHKKSQSSLRESIDAFLTSLEGQDVGQFQNVLDFLADTSKRLGRVGARRKSSSAPDTEKQKTWREAKRAYRARLRSKPASSDAYE